MSAEPKNAQRSSSVTRRRFLRRTGGVAATAAVAVHTTARSTRGAPGANERIGVGVIGCGGRGNSHLRVLKVLKAKGTAVDIVAVCDVYRPRMDKAASAYAATTYMDHHELLADKKVDAVCIATPDHIHGQQVIDAAKAGKDAYCEKPLTHWRQYEVTKRLLREVVPGKTIVQVGTQGMSDGAWHKAAELVKAGAIGQPIHAECGYFRVGDWGERGMSVDDPKAKPGADLRWEPFLGDSPKRAFDVSRFFRWRMYEDYSGGPVTDLFPHSLTPVVSILGVSMPSSVVASGGKYRYQEREVPDTFNMLIDYPEKITVAVLGTQGNNDPGMPSRGAGGMVPIIRGWDASLTVNLKDERIEIFPTHQSKAKARQIPVEYKENFEAYWKNFLECCRTRKQPWGRLELACHVQTALQMGMLALRKSRTAKFDATRQEIVV